MSERLNPTLLFDIIADELPSSLRDHMLVVGSLAAAYHHRDDLRFGGITTKDADIVIQPAGAIEQCREIAERLLAAGWRQKPSDRTPQSSPNDLNALPVIRLVPPKTDLFFVELLAFPDRDQTESKRMIPIQLSDGWYCLPSFRYLALTYAGPKRTERGLHSAAPEMMALANLLSHPKVGVDRMSGTIQGRSILRSAKDLGRVLALARLASTEGLEGWAEKWATALRDRFPDEFRSLAERAGNGLRELIADNVALDEARYAVDVGILAGYAVTTEQLRGIAAQMFAQVLDPLVESCAE